MMTILAACAPLLDAGRKRWRLAASGFIANRSGATAIEYTLLAVMIAVSLIFGAQLVGNSVSGVLNKTSNEMKNSL